MHVLSAVCEWLLALFIVVYSLMLIPEFHNFTVHVDLKLLNNNEHQPGETTASAESGEPAPSDQSGERDGLMDHQHNDHQYGVHV